MANDSWGTPPKLLEDVRKVFNGPIMLDPASNASAQRLFVQAREWYDEKNSGLNQDWTDREFVFLNPPYSRGNVNSFVTKFFDEVKLGIMVTNASTDTEWFQYGLRGKMIYPSISKLCFTRGRIAFIDPETQLPATNNNRGQCIWFLGGGEYKQRFINIFSRWGTVL